MQALFTISAFMALYFFSLFNSMILSSLSLADLVVAIAEVIEVLCKDGPAASATLLFSTFYPHALAASVDISLAQRAVIGIS